MGDIRNRFDSAFRDFNTFGVPASGDRKPPKVEIRAIGVAIEGGIAAAALSGTDLTAAMQLVAPLLATAQAAQVAAESALTVVQQALVAIPASVAAQLDQAVSLATAAAVASQANSAASAAAAANSAGLAQMAALTAPNVFATEADGRAGVPDGNTFWTDLGEAGLGLYRRTSSTVSALVATVVTGAMLASASGSALIGHSMAAIGSVVRPVQAVLRDAAFNPKDFGAIGDGQFHPLSERFSTLGAAQAVYPFVTSLNQSLDWAGIQAALNAASANENVRGVVRLPLGYYVLSDSVQVPNFCTLEGVSRYGCILFNQVVALAAPMLVNKRPDSFVGVVLRNFGIYGGTHAIKLFVTAEVAQVVLDGIFTAFQTVSVLEANSLQTTKFQDCQFGAAGSGYAINVTGFPCNAIEFYNTRVSRGAGGVLRLRGFDGVHWYGGSMEGNGRSLKATGSISGNVLTVSVLDDGVGPISVGDAVIHPDVTPGTVVTSRGSGTGGVGTYNLNHASSVANEQFIIGPATIDLEAGGAVASSCTFNGVYFEGTPRLLLRSVGTKGVSFDACKHTWATYGEPYIYDTGADMIAIGTNHFDTNVVGPLNTFMYGHTPRMGGNVNTWTRAGQNTGGVITRQRDLANGTTFDLFVFNRATATPGADNMHLISGMLTVVAQGYDVDGIARSINRTYMVSVQSASNAQITSAITQIDTQDNVSGISPQTILARVKATPGITELRIEVVATNFNTSLPSQVFATFEYAGAPTLVADAMRVFAS